MKPLQKQSTDIPTLLDRNKYKNVQEYVDTVYNKYWTCMFRDLDTRKFVEKYFIYIKQFSIYQDKLYSCNSLEEGLRNANEEWNTWHTWFNNTKDKSIIKFWDPNMTDDLFEMVLIAKTYQENNSSTNSMLQTAIHDAWALARLLSLKYDKSESKFIYNNFSENKRNGDDKLIKINFGDNRCTILQKRRLNQLVDFTSLSKKEQELDETPIRAFQNVFENENISVKTFINDFYENLSIQKRNLVQNYVNKIYDELWTKEFKNLNMIEFLNKYFYHIKKFSIYQDCLYSGDNEKKAANDFNTFKSMNNKKNIHPKNIYTLWTHDMTDDLFEMVLIAKLYKEKSLTYQVNEKMLQTAIHDAWALARLISYDYNKTNDTFEVKNFSERLSDVNKTNVNKTNVNKTLDNIVFSSDLEKDKTLIKITFGKNRQTNNRQTIVQARRATQLVPFDYLAEDQKKLDQTPIIAFKRVFAIPGKSNELNIGDVRIFFASFNDLINSTIKLGGGQKDGWQSTGKTIVLKDGRKCKTYFNPDYPNDIRIRKVSFVKINKKDLKVKSNKSA